MIDSLAGNLELDDLADREAERIISIIRFSPEK